MRKWQEPIGTLGELPGSGEFTIASITFVRPRTLTITARVTYNASASSGIRLKLYFSPDGKHYDTVPYTYFDVDFTAGATVQETHIIDAPEEGYMSVVVQNLDATYAATQIFVWSCVRAYPEE